MPKPRPEPIQDRWRLHSKANFAMAFATKQVQPGFQFRLTPSMELVQKGREFNLGGGKQLWNRNAMPHTTFRVLLNHIADHALKPSAKQGRGSDVLHKKGQGHVHFLYPQVSGNDRNVHDEGCHMPAREGFQRACPGFNCPYSVDKTKTTWYTMMKLGKDKHGSVVTERVHAILAAARWGIPDSVYDKKLGDKDTAQALHQPCCPGHSGGCCNPLHIEWNLSRINRHHQEVKKTCMNKGPLAHGPQNQVTLASD